MQKAKLNVNRCRYPQAIDPAMDAPGPDDASVHGWTAEPAVEITEVGPVAWCTCQRCPARLLHDPETEDGFEPVPVVVYPSSCFEHPGALDLADWCCCPRKATGDVVHLGGCVEDGAMGEAMARALRPSDRPSTEDVFAGAWASEAAS